MNPPPGGRGTTTARRARQLQQEDRGGSSDETTPDLEAGGAGPLHPDETTPSQGLFRAKAATHTPDRRAAALTVSVSRWMRPEQPPNSSSRSSRFPHCAGLPRASPLLSLTAISEANASSDTASDALKPANRRTVGADPSAFFSPLNQSVIASSRARTLYDTKWTARAPNGSADIA